MGNESVAPEYVAHKTELALDRRREEYGVIGVHYCTGATMRCEVDQREAVQMGPVGPSDHDSVSPEVGGKAQRLSVFVRVGIGHHPRDAGHKQFDSNLRYLLQQAKVRALCAEVHLEAVREPIECPIERYIGRRTSSRRVVEYCPVRGYDLIHYQLLLPGPGVSDIRVLSEVCA